jgi:hypothetical protein
MTDRETTDEKPLDTFFCLCAVVGRDRMVVEFATAYAISAFHS